MDCKRYISAALAAALTLSLAACGQQGGSSASASAPAPSASGGGETSAGVAVQVEEVVLNSIATENKVSGRIAADSESTVMVAASAKCTAVYVEAGDVVQAGDKLCTLDMAGTLASYNAASINYQATRKSYEDQKAILDKQIKLAEDNVNNLKALFEIGAASQLEIDNAELSLQQAVAGRDNALSQLEAGMQSGKSNLEQLEMVLENVDSRGNVVAPISGTVVSLSATEDGYISPSMPVAVIDGVEQMKVVVSVSEALVPKLTIGDEADVWVSAVGASFTGTIRGVEKAANMQTRLYNVTLSIPAEVEGLLSGMFADVSFHTDGADSVVVIPTEAILTRGETQYVFVVENGAARYVEVQTGLTGSGVTQVLSGLNPGQQLVTVGQAYLSDGQEVRVVPGED